jgi:hypothetical protein
VGLASSIKRLFDLRNGAFFAYGKNLRHRHTALLKTPAASRQGVRRNRGIT